MRNILPGRPQAKLQAVTTGVWDEQSIVAYISGNALIILNTDLPNHVVQTIYLEEEENDGLEAVSFDEGTGKIAVSSKHSTYIYRPYNHEYGVSKWTLHARHFLSDPRDTVTTLSWGALDELLVGSATLTLLNTRASLERIWTKRLANPVKFAEFSPDAELIASTSKHDCLLKVWRRLGFGSTAQRFDYYYLQHPTVITGVHWRQSLKKDHVVNNVLYTVCADQKVRIWVTGAHHGMDALALWATVDLMNPSTLRSPDRKIDKRYVLFIDGRHFVPAAKAAIAQATAAEKDQLAINHLIEVLDRNPEICVVFDDKGTMSAWGFENIGMKEKKITDVFPVTHIEGLGLHLDGNASGDHIQMHAFHSNHFVILIHRFDGSLEWSQARLDYLLDPTPSQNSRIERKAIWTGHEKSIEKISRSPSGKALLSRAKSGETTIWHQSKTVQGMTLNRHSIMDAGEHRILQTVLFQEGNFILLMHSSCVTLWDARSPTAKQLAQLSYTMSGEPLCLLVIPETQEVAEKVHVAAISSQLKSVCWELQLPSTTRRVSDTLRLSDRGVHTNGYISKRSEVQIEEITSSSLGSGQDLTLIMPIDSAGSAPVISGFLDTFARDIAISHDRSGTLRLWTARIIGSKRRLEWLQTITVDSAIPNPALVSGNSIRKAAIVKADQSTLTIWDTRNAQLEYEEKFEDIGVIQDLDWSSTPDNQSILAVGFPHIVIIYAQLRYDYLSIRPAWAAIRQIDINDITSHPIGDSVWLSSGNLVIGAGNQLFVQDEKVEVSESIFPGIRSISRTTATVNIFDAVSRLNGPLPVYHPQLLSQSVLVGKFLLVQRILVRLFQKLKFYTEGEELDSLLGFSPEDFSQTDESLKTLSAKNRYSSYANLQDDDEPGFVTEEVASSLNELLQLKRLPLLTRREQLHLTIILECVALAERHRRSIDENARSFLLFFREHVLSDAKSEPISWREIIWAFHSGSQDILVDIVSRHFKGKILWADARQSGLFMWLKDASALRAQFEVIARNEYTKTDEKNPVDCSLYYLALKKKAVLLGLWRMATWSREQPAIRRLLANNFEEKRWKTAALKNAYALMGKHRFEYAAAFFLLADHLYDAISVLHNQLGDTQLAIAVARVYGGDESPILIDFLRQKILPQAAREGNRWLATWAFWLLNKRDSAVRSLVSPLTTLMSPPQTPNFQSRSYLTDDPALVVLYRQLRGKSLQTLRGASMIDGREEWDFLIKTAQLYERMGCDVLALDLVKTWEFLAPPPPKLIDSIAPLSPALPRSNFHARNSTQAEADFDFDPRKLLRRRSSLVVADLPVREHMVSGHTDKADEKENVGDEKKKTKKGEVEKKSPTHFQEPDADSLLDAFGF